MVSVQAELLRYDFNGNKTIVERFSKNDIFGEVFYVVTTNNEFLLLLNRVVMFFFLFMIIFKKCKSNCKFHQYLNDNLS